MGHELLVTLEHTDKGVIAVCDELSAVASGATEEEAVENLMQAIEALIETYGDEIKKRLEERSLKVVEVS